MEELAGEIKKVRLQVTVREDLVKWIDQKILKTGRFASRSHAIDCALCQMKGKENPVSENTGDL